MSKKIIVVGGGIAGLSVCYELSKIKNYSIELYEMKEHLGGLSKSNRYKDGIYDEHSWRGFNSNYKNLLDIMKNIKDGDHNLIKNLNTKNKLISSLNTYTPLLKSVTFLSVLKLIHFHLSCQLSGTKRVNNILAYQKIMDRLSFLNKKSMYLILDTLLHIGPDPAIISVKSSINAARHFVTDEWYHLGKPTQEGLISPWEKHLSKNNVKIYKKHKLTKINFDNNAITNLVFNDNKVKKADYYVLALPPYALNTLFFQTNISIPTKIQLKKLDETGYHKEISFRLFFKEKVNVGSNLSLPETDWGIVLIPIHEYWFKDTYLGKDIKSIISGTCVTGYQSSSKTNKNIFTSKLNQIKKEIKRQLESNTELNTLLKKNNKGKELKDFKYTIKLWKEWYNTPNGSNTNDVYWTNTYQTAKYRLDQDIGIKNTFFCGVHTKTVTDIATMESACESAKLACIQLLKKDNKKHNIYLYQYKKNIFLRAIHAVDDILYYLNAPNVFTVTVILVLITLLYKWKLKALL